MRDDPIQPPISASDQSPSFDETGRRKVASSQEDTVTPTRKRASVRPRGEDAPARRIFRVIEMPPLQRPPEIPSPMGDLPIPSATPAALPAESQRLNLPFVIAGIALVALILALILVLTHQHGSTPQTSSPPPVVQSATIAFHSVPVTVPAPPAAIAVSTATSSPIKVTTLILSGYTVSTGNISATKNSNGTYSVPANCGDPGLPSSIAIAYLQQQLSAEVPSGDIVVTATNATADAGSLTCSPAAGTTRSASFNYIDTIRASAIMGVAAVADVQSYQRAQLQQALSKLSGTYANLTDTICTTPTVGTLDTNGATITCTATATATRVWDAATLRALAAKIAGMTIAAATSTLESTPGIAPGSVQISITGGGTTLPQDAGNITITAS